MRLPYRLLLVVIAPKESCFSCSYPAARAAAALKLLFVQPKALVQLSLKKAATRSATARAPVVLSRVRTLTGLLDFSPNPDYLEMMERLRLTILSSSPMETK